MEKLFLIFAVVTIDLHHVIFELSVYKVRFLRAGHTKQKLTHK